MLKTISEETEIQHCQKRFVEALKGQSSDRLPVNVGHLGASYDMEATYIEKQALWFVSKRIENSRYWNGFGIGYPERKTSLSITCEINFPLNGINRRVAGAFATDQKGERYVIHRGNIGGGRKGISKTLFKNCYKGEWIELDDGEITSSVALIGALGSDDLPTRVGRFVHEIDEIKKRR
ncbi:MAG: hypothetical protein A3G34_03670 [Candidatus Lindowbacteria bacterium RIFCSPLOWO2_12_FULL_62_27]|nr:MAG: hypothetical protein A3G34_03670 [Candidatus Lindowbacteria bacterium RIFCSPLOWO2_12_FULL_62_27]OGH61832.1 MAG: hypothetical protein A3I06_09455 [Candidatus Lindowbacteria bacterium RIFCSPLOWO2_02_FULL_62_12]